MSAPRKIPFGEVGCYVHYDQWGWGTGIVTQVLPGYGKFYVQFVGIGAAIRDVDLEPATREQVAAVKNLLPEPGISWLDV